MIGDIIIIEEIHSRKATKAYIAFRESLKRKMVIAIGGRSGTGKTEIASLFQRWLFERKNKRSKIIHLDDYYNSDFQNRNAIRADTGVIGAKEVNWSKVNKVIKDFKENRRKLYVQRIHKYLNAYEHSISPGHKIDILIVEGLYANSLGKHKDFGIFLEGSDEDTYEFRVKRGKENPNDAFRKRVLETEAKDVDLSKKYADLIIPFEV
jgi:uridine kinase